MSLVHCDANKNIVPDISLLFFVVVATTAPARETGRYERLKRRIQTKRNINTEVIRILSKDAIAKILTRNRDMH